MTLFAMTRFLFAVANTIVFYFQAGSFNFMFALIKEDLMPLDNR